MAQVIYMAQNDVPSFQVVRNDDGLGYDDVITNESSFTPAFR